MKFDQTTIKSKLISYLNAEAQEKFQVPNYKLIRKLEAGYCCGITCLWLRAKWHTEFGLRFSHLKPRGEADWFFSTVNKILQWDNNLASLSNSDREDIQFFLTRIEQYQNLPEYLSSAKQGDLHKSFFEFYEDINGEIINHSLNLEYTLAGAFTQYKLAFLLSTLIYEGRLVVLSTKTHDTGLIRKGDTCYFLNANTGEETIVADIHEVAAQIFKANSFDIDTSTNALGIGFRIFNFGSAQAHYLSQHDLLSYYAEPKGGLYNAAWIGCAASAEYILNHTHTNINDPSPGGATPFFVACQNGNLEVVELFLRCPGINLVQGFYANPNFSPFMVACSNGRTQIVGLHIGLMPNPAGYLQIQDIYGKTALHYAAMNGHAETVALLMSYQANPFTYDYYGNTPFSLAQQNNDEKIVRLLSINPESPAIQSSLQDDVTQKTSVKAELPEEETENVFAESEDSDDELFDFDKQRTYAGKLELLRKMYRSVVDKSAAFITRATSKDSSPGSSPFSPLSPLLSTQKNARQKSPQVPAKNLSQQGSPSIKPLQSPIETPPGSPLQKDMLHIYNVGKTPSSAFFTAKANATKSDNATSAALKISGLPSRSTPGLW